MNYEEFKVKLENNINLLSIKINEESINKFFLYMNLLKEWNEKINLTAIKEENEIIVKHFLDSLTIQKYISNNDRIIDIGSGAGFPGIPLKIINSNLDITLLDSLNKRVNFLKIIIEELKLNKIEAIHGRAEEFLKNKKDSYDIAVTRAVASLDVLIKYTIPYIKKDGKCICMKGPNIEEELEKSKNALKKFNCEIEKIDSFNLPDTNMERKIIIIRKI